MNNLFCDRVTDLEYFERGNVVTKSAIQFSVFEANQSEITFTNQSFI